MSRRHTTYFALRAVSGLAFVLAATVLPRGVPAALVILVAGLVAVGTSLGTNAGGPGERAGARPQDRYFNTLRAPQGQWPPFDHEDRSPDATPRP